MQDVQKVYILVVVLGGVLSLFLCLYAVFKFKKGPEVRYYILATLMSSFFTFFYAGELSSNSLEQIKFWLGMEYYPLPFIPVFILLMVMQYVGLNIKKWVYYILFGFATLTVLIQHTNDYHKLYYKEIGLQEDTPFLIADLDGGEWFVAHSIFLYLCVLISVILLIKQVVKVAKPFRYQTMFMIIGLLIPVIASLFYVSGKSPDGLDLGPISMSISFLFHGFALLSFRMFELIPIAKEKVFESMEEGLLVLNKEHLIVDYNQAVLTIFPQLNQLIGKDVRNIDPSNKSLFDAINKEVECDLEFLISGNVQHFHIRFSRVLNNKNQSIGKVITFINVTERVLMEKQLKHLATIDGLTSIYNRSYFFEMTEKVLRDCKYREGNLSVIMFDLDYFKKINDRYGHEAGDFVLANVARIAKSLLRKNDILGRFGGEEFLISLPDTTLKEAYAMAELIRNTIEMSQTVLPSGVKIEYTASFGVTGISILPKLCSDCLNHFNSEKCQSCLDIILNEADKALYKAKENGRNRVECFKQDTVVS